MEQSNFKYRIVDTEGCTAYNFTINERNVQDYTPEEMDKMVDYLFEKLKEHIRDRHVDFRDLVKLFQYNEFICDFKKCESCGDMITETVWEL